MTMYVHVHNMNIILYTCKAKQASRKNFRLKYLAVLAQRQLVNSDRNMHLLAISGGDYLTDRNEPELETISRNGTN